MPSIRSHRVPWAVALAALAVGGTAAGQAEVDRIIGTYWNGGWGASLANVGDVDGDSCDDWLSGEPRTPAGGRVELRSGATRALLRTHAGPSQADDFGQCVAALPDRDGDGVGDYAIGAPGHWIGSVQEPGHVSVFSGASGALLFSADGKAKLERFGTRIAGLDDIDGDGLGELLVFKESYAFVLSETGGRIAALNLQSRLTDAIVMDDVDGDGRRDIAVGSSYYSGALGKEGRVYYYSGRTAKLFARYDGAARSDFIGRRLAVADDHDNDGVADLLVAGGIDDTGSGGPFDGHVELRSGATFALLRTYVGGSGEYFGSNLAAGGDWDGDGDGDHFIHALFPFLNGSVRLFSGATGTLLHEWIGEYLSNSHDHNLGIGLAPGDFDHDGDGDVVIGASGWHDANGGYEGIVHVFKGCRALRIAYGTGFPGTLGIPVLAASDEPGLGATITLTADNSLGAATTGVLVIGNAPDNNLLSNGATMWVDPMVIEPIVLPPAGWNDIVALPSDPVFCDLDLYLQVFELDAGAAGSISATQGLQLRIGFDY